MDRELKSNEDQPERDSPAGPQGDEGTATPGEDASSFDTGASPPGMPPHNMMAFQFSAGPASDKFIEKLDSDHIRQIIKSTDENSQREDTRLKQFFWGGIGAFIVICTLFLAFNETEYLQEIIAALIGFGGGYGYGRYKHSL